MEWYHYEHVCLGHACFIFSVALLSYHCTVRLNNVPPKIKLHVEIKPYFGLYSYTFLTVIIAHAIYLNLKYNYNYPLLGYIISLIAQNSSGFSCFLPFCENYYHGAYVRYCRPRGSMQNQDVPLGLNVNPIFVAAHC